MDHILRKIESFIPKKIYTFFQPAYHYLMALLGAIYYDFPAKKLVVIAVTGTKGKSSTTELINAILEKAKYKTALSNTIRFKILDDSRANKQKMSMPGRFFMQEFLSNAVRAKATHAVIEITSEGARQFRNKWIDLDMAVWTNLAPEHIERHGSYENYRQAKIDIIKEIEKSNKKGTVTILNGDDPELPYFLPIKSHIQKVFSFDEIESFHEGKDGIKFMYKRLLFTSPLLGRFNAYNILSAIKVAEELDIPIDTIRKALSEFRLINGRAEKILIDGQPPAGGFEVIVDYAHTPESLEAIYQTFEYAKKRICVLGNTGGGRDTWKRPIMAEIAERYCDHIILTNEDPYDEDPEKIVSEMKQVITKKPCEVIMDRRSAIAHAIGLAKKGDAVLITGKGTDPYIMGPNGEKTPWSDAEVAREELKKLSTPN